MNQRNKGSATHTSKRDTAVALSDAESTALKIRQDIGLRLTKIRGHSLSQTEFAKKFGVHKNTYAAWERGERDIDASALRLLAVDGWSPMWVLTGEGRDRLDPTMRPDAAVDTALVVGRDDKEAEARREARMQGFADGQRMALETAAQSHSQSLRQDDLTMAIQLADEVLEGKVLPREKRAELVAIVYDMLVEGLPEAKVLRFARVAAG